MTKEEMLSAFLKQISQNIPTNAVELRACSDSIISKWINLKFEYPHDIIESFVAFESCIEDTIEGNANDPVKLEHECKEDYAFYINPFIAALVELQSFVEGHR
jgi:hypothetical protein